METWAVTADIAWSDGRWADAEAAWLKVGVLALCVGDGVVRAEALLMEATAMLANNRQQQFVEARLGLAVRCAEVAGVVEQDWFSVRHERLNRQLTQRRLPWRERALNYLSW